MPPELLAERFHLSTEIRLPFVEVRELALQPVFCLSIGEG